MALPSMAAHPCMLYSTTTDRLSCRFCTIPSSAHGVQGKCKCLGKSTPIKVLNLVCVQCGHVCRCRTPMQCKLNSTIVYHPCVYICRLPPLPKSSCEVCLVQNGSKLLPSTMVLIYVKRVCETKGQQESQALAYSYKARSVDVVSDVHWKKTM